MTRLGYKIKLLIGVMLIAFSFSSALPVLAVEEGDQCFCYNTDNGCDRPGTFDPQTASECQADCDEIYGASLENAEFISTDDPNYGVALNDCSAAATFAEATAVDEGERTPIPPIIPKLSVELPGFSFSEVLEDGEYLEINFIGEYVAAWYEWLLGAAVIVATVMIMIGGVQYMIGKGAGEVQKGKERIKNAIIGLVLLLGSYTILYTVNPKLTEFDPLSLEKIPYAALPDEIKEDPAYNPTLGKLCGTIDECRQWCEATNWGKDRDYLAKKVPGEKTAGMAGPSELVNLGERPIENLETRGDPSDHYLTEEAWNGLRDAAAEAKKHNVTLYLTSSYRSLITGLYLACNEIKAADAAGRTPNIPSAVAWPGTSSHGSGTAVDVKFIDSSGNMSWNVSYGTQNSADPEKVKLLAEIMYATGWARYINEIWHFDFNGASKPCRSTSCTRFASGCSC